MILYFDDRSFIAEIVLNWTEAKSPLYQRFVIEAACLIDDRLFELICLMPDFYTRWINVCYKQGWTPMESALHITNIINLLIKKSKNRKYDFLRFQERNDCMARQKQ